MKLFSFTQAEGGEPMNISKFTQKSVQAVQNLEKVAYEYGNQEIEQEHLLYTLLTQEDSLILKLIDKMDIPGEITIQISGSYEDQQDSFRDLGTLGILIVILVFIVMAAQFESLTYPFIIMFSLPFAFSGVLMALFFTGSTLSVMSLLGGIMLIGIVVKNGIVLIDYITLCRERGLAVVNSVVTSGKSRLRPVLMTTATTVLGMIPMAIGGGQGSEMWSPMAIAVIGGLTISTVLTLILIPTLYCVFAGTGIKNQRRKLRRQRELDTYFQEHKNDIIKK